MSDLALTGAKSAHERPFFYNQSSALELLRRVRWRDGISCPRCQSVDIRQVRTDRMIEALACRNCGYNFSTAAESYFQGSRIPLHEQLRFIVTQQLEPKSSAGRLARLFHWKTSTVSRQLAKLPQSTGVEFARAAKDYKPPEEFISITEYLEQDGIAFSLDLFEQHLGCMFGSETRSPTSRRDVPKAVVRKKASRTAAIVPIRVDPTPSDRWLLPSSIPYLVDKDSARNLAIAVHWKDGIPKCPGCHSDQIIRLNTREPRELYRCRRCDRVFNSLVGTIFARSKMSTHRFFQFFVLHNALKEDLTTQEICFAIQCTPKTASLWLKRAKEIGYPFDFAVTDKRLPSSLFGSPPVEDNFFFLCALKGIVVDELKLRQFIELVAQI